MRSERTMPLFVAAVIVLSLAAAAGCQAKKEKPVEEAAAAGQSGVAPITEEGGQGMAQEAGVTTVVEQIPPTAAVPEAVGRVKAAVGEQTGPVKDIQTALKNTGFYNGAIDGKLGPKTKKAIEEFQKSKGLKADGKVGTKTWVELQKFLAQ